MHVSFSASCFIFGVFLVNDEIGLSWFSCFSNGFLILKCFNFLILISRKTFFLEIQEKAIPVKFCYSRR